METSKILEKGKCCACEAPLEYSRHLNMVTVDMDPKWKYPIVGNVLTNDPPKSAAFICDRCYEAGTAGSAPAIKNVVEFQEKEIIYHPIK